MEVDGIGTWSACNAWHGCTSQSAAVVHNEIHNRQKPSEALPSQVFQVVAKVIRGQRATLLLVRPQRAHQRAQSPLVEAYTQILIL